MSKRKINQLNNISYLIFNCIQSVKDEEDISEEYDLSKLEEHTLGVLEAKKAFI